MEIIAKQSKISRDPYESTQNQYQPTQNKPKSSQIKAQLAYIDINPHWINTNVQWININPHNSEENQYEWTYSSTMSTEINRNQHKWSQIRAQSI